MWAPKLARFLPEGVAKGRFQAVGTGNEHFATKCVALNYTRFLKHC